MRPRTRWKLVAVSPLFSLTSRPSVRLPADPSEILGRTTTVCRRRLGRVIYFFRDNTEWADTRLRTAVVPTRAPFRPLRVFHSSSPSSPAPQVVVAPLEQARLRCNRRSTMTSGLFRSVIITSCWSSSSFLAAVSSKSPANQRRS